MNKLKYKRILSVIILLCFMMPYISLYAISKFVTHWSEPYYNILIENGIAANDKYTRVNPDDPILRSDYVELINKAFHFTEYDDSNFKDVSAGRWFYTDFAIAKKAGYIIGDENGDALPEKPITRGEIAVITARVLELDLSKTVCKFKDAGDMPDWALPSIIALQDSHVINGYPDGTFKYDNNLTYGEGITIIANIVNYGKNIRIIPEDKIPEGPAVPNKKPQTQNPVIPQPSSKSYPPITAKSSPAPTPNVDITPTPSPLNTSTPTPSPLVKSSPMPSPVKTSTPKPTPSKEPTPEPSIIPSPDPTIPPSASPSASPTPTPTSKVTVVFYFNPTNDRILLIDLDGEQVSGLIEISGFEMKVDNGRAIAPYAATEVTPDNYYTLIVNNIIYTGIILDYYK